MSAVINQRDTRAEMTLFIWVLLAPEFPRLKTWRAFAVMCWKVHFLGAMDEPVCRIM